jgi:hypothetical protein
LVDGRPLQRVKGNKKQPKQYHHLPNKTYQQFTKNKKKKRKNLRKSLPSYGWIPDPEAYMCIQKKNQLNHPKFIKKKKKKKPYVKNQLTTSWSPFSPSGKNFFKTSLKK